MKSFFKFFIPVVIVIALFIFFIPTLLSTRYGTSLLTKIINKKMEGSITIEDLELTWGGPQVVTGLLFQEETTKSTIRIEKGTTTASLWELYTTHWPYFKGQLDLKAETTFQNQKGSFQITMNDGTLNAESKGFPLHSLDQFLDPSYRGILIAAIGDTLDLHLQASLIPESLRFHLSAFSTHFTADIETTAQGNTLLLSKPATISCTLPPDLFKALFPAIPYALKEAAFLNVNLKSGSFPFTAEKIDWQKASFDLTLDSSAVQLDKSKLASFSLAARSNEVDKGIDTTLQGSFEQNKDEILTLFGPTMTFNLSGKLGPDTGYFTCSLSSPLVKLSPSQFSYKEVLKLDSPLLLTLNAPIPASVSITSLSLPRQIGAITLSAEVIALEHRAQITVQTLQDVAINISGKTLTTTLFTSLSNNEFTLKKTAAASYLLTPDQLPEAHLMAPALLQAQIEPFTVPLDARALSLFKIKGTLQTQKMLFEQGNLDNLSLAFNASSTTFSADVKGTIIKNDQAAGVAAFKVQADDLNWSSKFDLSTAHIQAQGKIKDLATSFVDAFLNQPLSQLVGPQIDLDFSIKNTSQEKLFDITANSPLLHLVAALQVKGDQLQLKKGPAEIRLKLTEQGYALLDQWFTHQKQAPFTLAEPSAITLMISDLQYPLSTAKTPSFKASAKLLVDRFAFREKSSGQLIEISELSATIDKNQKISFSVNSALVSGGKKGKISALGQTTDNSFNFELALEQFPVTVLDLIARAQGRTDAPFNTLFGATLNATAKAALSQLSGPIQFVLASPNTRCSLNGQLSKGILTLNEPIHAQMMMTSDLSRLLLKEANPLSLSAISARNPITLVIPPQDFSTLVYPFNASQMNIPNLRLELGQIVCHNEGNINIALGLLKSKSARDKDLNLWFAPIDMHIKQGIVDWERTEILVDNSLEIAIWGALDFVKDQVDMVLGLTAQCLRKAFGIKNLPSDYVLQIPMKGSLNNVQINTNKATSKVTALLLWQQRSLAGGAVGGGTGLLLGELLNQLGALPDNDTSAPPAKHPFPWEKSSQQETPKQKQNPLKKRKIKSKDKPLKQILKVIR